MRMTTKNIFIGLTLLAVFWAGGQALADKREFDVFLGAKGEYNDNIFFTADDTISDFITTLSGGLKFLNQTERTDLFLSGIVERLLYSDEKDLDNWDQYYKGRFGYKFTERFRAQVDAAYTQDSRPDRDVADSGLILAAVPRVIQKYGAAADYDITEITTSNLFYRYTQQDFEPRQVNVILDDYRAHRAGLGFVHRLDKYLPNTAGRLNFGYNKFTYPESGTETKVVYGTVGVAYDFTEKWRFLIDIGPNYYDTEFNIFGDNFNYSGWGGTGTLKIAYTGEYTGSSLTLSHGIEPASGRSGSSERTYGIFDIYYRFAERGRVGFETGYYVNKANSGELAILPLDEHTFNIRPWLRFDILFDKLYLEGSYTYSQIDDKVFGQRDRSRNLVWLQLGLDWPILE
jgi:hypothetical protein